MVRNWNKRRRADKARESQERERTSIYELADRASCWRGTSEMLSTHSASSLGPRLENLGASHGIFLELEELICARRCLASRRDNSSQGRR